MMLCHIYLRKGTVYVPTVAKTEAGFFVDVEPVAVIEGSDRARIADAIKKTIIKGNPTIETPTRLTFPKPVVLSYANVKSWATFEKSSLCWKASKRKASCNCARNGRIQTADGKTIPRRLRFSPDQWRSMRLPKWLPNRFSGGCHD